MMQKRRKGLSLLELIIAMFLVTVAFLAMVSVYPAVYRKSTQQKNRFIAIAVGEGILESLDSLPWGEEPPPELLKSQKFQQVVEGQEQEVEFEIIEVDGKKIHFDPSKTGNGPDPDIPACTVEFTIEWEEGTGPSSAGVKKKYKVKGEITR